MPSRRELAAGALRYSGLRPLASSLRRGVRKTLTILAYHRVATHPSVGTGQTDDELISASPEQFKRQMQFVRENFTPLTFAELHSLRTEGREIPPSPLIVTFDDGFADNYLFAYPILRELDVPATIFLVTENLDSGASFWFERLARAVLSGTLSGNGKLPAAVPVEGPEISPRLALAGLLSQLKRMSEPERLAYLAETFVGSDSDCPIECRPLTWAHVREMAQHGIEFGSHTMTHPILTRVDDSQLATELSGSKARIEHMLEREVLALAYPVGGASAVDSRVQEKARFAGYRYACVYQPGVNALETNDWHTLRRIRIERYVSQSLFEASLLLPEVFT